VRFFIAITDSDWFSYLRSVHSMKLTFGNRAEALIVYDVRATV